MGEVPSGGSFDPKCDEAKVDIGHNAFWSYSRMSQGREIAEFRGASGSEMERQMAKKWGYGTLR